MTILVLGKLIPGLEELYTVLLPYLYVLHKVMLLENNCGN